MKYQHELKSRDRVKQDSCESDQPQMFAPNTLGFYKKYQTYTCLVVPIDEEIVSPMYYRNILRAIAELNEGDMIQFDINSPGGDLYGLVSLLNAINETEATTVANIIGQASSSASMLSLCCDHVNVSPYATMLIHTGSYFGIEGKSSDVKGYVQHLEKTSEALTKATYQGFLTDVEITKVLDGIDIWLNAAEIQGRLDKREVYREKIIKDSVESVLTPLEISEEVPVKAKRVRKPKKEISVDNFVDKS